MVQGHASGAPYLTRIPNLEDLRPVFSERETSHSPTNRVAVWRTRGPFVDLLTPKGDRRVTNFSAHSRAVMIRKWRTRGNRSFLSRVHEHTMVNAFKSLRVGFLRSVQACPNSTEESGGTPRSALQKAQVDRRNFSRMSQTGQRGCWRGSAGRGRVPHHVFRPKRQQQKIAPEMDK